MLHMVWLWLKNRWRGVSAVLIIVLAVLIVMLVGAGGSGLGVSFLGNANAPRIVPENSASGTVLPRSSNPDAQLGKAPDPNASILDTNLATSAGLPDIAAAQATWSAEEIRERQNAVLSAVNCARKQQRLEALALDPALSQTAGNAWLKLSHDHSWSLMDLPGTYELRSVMALDFSAPGSAVGTGQGGQQGQAAQTCTVGGFDAATLPPTRGAATIGIAVFPPQTSWDSASAVVLVK